MDMRKKKNPDSLRCRDFHCIVARTVIANDIVVPLSAENQPLRTVPKMELVITQYYSSAKYLMVRTIWLV